MAIQNKTPNYGLPLPQGNEVMAYQDFINEPMQIIDTQMKSNADGVAANKADLVTANQNISEVDGKVAAIQANLDEWNVPGIINEQTSMDQRLTEVEETTMQFVHPDVSLYVTGAKTGDTYRTIRSGGMITFTSMHVDTRNFVALTNNANYFNGEDLASNYNGYKVGSMPGNVFNLPNVNKNYRYTAMNLLIYNDTASTYTSGNGSFFFKWNGSETEIFLNRGSNSWDNREVIIMYGASVPLGLF